MRTSLCPLWLVAVCVLAASFLPAADAPATASENDKEIVMENGLLSLVISKQSGSISSIKYNHNGRMTELGNGKNAMYFDANGGPVVVPADQESKRPKSDLANPTKGAEFQVVQKGPEDAEVAIFGKPTFWFPFRIAVHYILRRGQSGWYAYALYEHGLDMPAAALGQTRFVVRGVPGPRLFTHHVVDEQRKGPFPTAQEVETIQDATVRLEDGTIYTKYDNTVAEGEHHVHGMAGHGLGLWMIFPSNEFIGGGPVKQELSVHIDNVVLAMLLGGHFGSGGLEFKDNETWHKLYGPVFVYVNAGDSIEALYDDAKRRAREEIAAWPYAWLVHSEYPLEGGTLSGHVQLDDGGSVKDAWAILAPPGEDWTQCSKGYQFWTKTDAEGQFTFGKVRPGKYTLFISGANQFEDLRLDVCEVQAGLYSFLGDWGEDKKLVPFVWKTKKHGNTLWQIGVADRSAREFKGGDNCRHYGNFLRYPQEFPDDVTFVIGKSKESADWNFAQWSWYNKKPVWTIQFNLDQALAGKATLTLGFAAAQPVGGQTTNLQVKANGQEIGVVRLKKSGSAGYRSGCQDSAYNVEYITFDAGVFRTGANEITLGHAEAIPFPTEEQMKHARLGHVMYDAIRLEVEP
ncbi:MAG: polysaccharide lyase family protein [Planctomycetota bacterium]